MMRSLALLLLCSCSSQVAGNVPAFERVSYLGEHDPRDVALAVHCWRAALSWWTGELADVARVTIETREIPGEQTGAWRSGSLVIEPGPLSSSTLAHELTHDHLDRVHGDPDADHADGNGPWTAIHDAVIEEAGDEMRRLGL